MQKRREHDDHGEDQTYVFTRAEDRSNWIRLSYILDKYKPIVWLIMASLIAMGFGFKTPKQALGEVKDSVDSVKVRVTSLESMVRMQHQDIQNLLRLRCLDTNKDPDKCFQEIP